VSIFQVYQPKLVCLSLLSNVHLTLDLVILITCLYVCIIRFIAHMCHCCFGFGWMKQNKWQHKFIPAVKEHKNCSECMFTNINKFCVGVFLSTPVLFSVSRFSFYRLSYV
jgi:hypothetical protein